MENEITQPNQKDMVKRLAMEMIKMPQAELETSHFFADGMYARMVPRLAGTLIVGKVHKKEHFYIVLSGCVDVTSGDSVKRLRAPSVITSKPGTQRAVLAIEDSVCMTVHRTDNTDLGEIERELVEPCDYAMFGPSNKLIEVAA